jgi:hypothetical protein
VSVAPAQSSALTPAELALAPAEVRDGSSATKQAYATALEFEKLLVGQLSEQLARQLDSSSQSGDGDDGSAGGGANQALASLLPGALTSSIMSDGGLGLAAQLMGTIDPGASAPAAHARGRS